MYQLSFIHSFIPINFEKISTLRIISKIVSECTECYHLFVSFLINFQLLNIEQFNIFLKAFYSCIEIVYGVSFGRSTPYRANEVDLELTNHHDYYGHHFESG